MVKIQILIGSETGTARRTAFNIQAELKDLGHQVSVNQQPSCAELVRDDKELLLICTSSTGAGELPSNIRPLYHEMLNAPPRIYGRQYGIISLGDSSFSTYGEAGVLLDELFTDYGAIRIGALFQIDGMETFEPEKVASNWAVEWIRQFENQSL